MRGTAWLRELLAGQRRIAMEAARSVGFTFVSHFRSQAALRMRRFVIVSILYQRLYNSLTLRGLLLSMRANFKRYRLLLPIRTGLCLGASSFSFRHQGISDDEMNSISQSFKSPSKTEGSSDLPAESQTTAPKSAPTGCERKKTSSTGKKPSRPARSVNIDNFDPSSTDFDGVLRQPNREHSESSKGPEWELIIENSNFKLWRRPLVDDSYLYEYKAFGCYTDVSAYAFFATQLDLDYRKQWDKQVISLEVVDSDRDTRAEVIRWLTHYPYPMQPREYLYVRRACVDQSSQVMVVVSRQVQHPDYPADPAKAVRVERYYSSMVIRPHTSFEEEGFDYILAYCDDPQAPIPTPAYRWLASAGIPGFLEQIHAASKKLQSRNQDLLDRVISSGIAESL